MIQIRTSNPWGHTVDPSKAIDECKHNQVSGLSKSLQGHAIKVGPALKGIKPISHIHDCEHD